MLNRAVKMDYIPRNFLSDIGDFKDTTLEAHTQKLHYYTADEFKRRTAPPNLPPIPSPIEATMFSLT